MYLSWFFMKVHDHDLQNILYLSLNNIICVMYWIYVVLHLPYLFSIIIRIKPDYLAVNGWVMFGRNVIIQRDITSQALPMVSGFKHVKAIE